MVESASPFAAITGTTGPDQKVYGLSSGGMMHHNDIPHGQAVHQRFYKYYDSSGMCERERGQSGAWQIHSNNAWVQWHNLCSSLYSHTT